MAEYPQYVRVIKRSKRKHSIVFRFWIRFIPLFLMFAGVPFLVCIFLDGGKNFLSYVLACGGFGLFMAPFYSFLNKGSLADVVYVDYIKQEIRANHYTIGNRQLKTVIPFEGMTWEVVWGGRSLDRLRIFSQDGKKIVICEGGLGWTWNDFGQLKSALTKVVEREHGFGRI